MTNLPQRRSYDAEFKRNAVTLSQEPDRKTVDVEASLGVPQGTIGRWRRQLHDNGSLAFPGHGIEALTPEQKRIKELEKQLRDTQVERDILKKAAAYFSMDALPGLRS